MIEFRLYGGSGVDAFDTILSRILVIRSGFVKLFVIRLIKAYSSNRLNFCQCMKCVPCESV